MKWIISYLVKTWQIVHSSLLLPCQHFRNRPVMLLHELTNTVIVEKTFTTLHGTMSHLSLFRAFIRIQEFSNIINTVSWINNLLMSNYIQIWCCMAVHCGKKIYNTYGSFAVWLMVQSSFKWSNSTNTCNLNITIGYKRKRSQCYRQG